MRAFPSKQKARPKRLSSFACLLALIISTGCQSYRRPAIPTALPTTYPTGLSNPTPSEDLQAIVVPPSGWIADPIKSSDRHVHQTWVSPSGDTAYGVIRMRLPLPVGTDLVLWGFMNEMRKEEGEGTLLERRYDPDLPGARFVAEGGRYKIRVNLLTRGFTAWAIYAGSLRERPENPSEIALAELARESTLTGLPKRPPASQNTSTATANP